MQVQVNGDISKFLRAFTADIKQPLREALDEASELIRVGTKIHRYQNHTRNLERSIIRKVSGLTAKVFSDPASIAAPYAMRIHEGFAGKTDSKGRTFKGPQKDQFLYEAKNRNIANINRIFGKAISKAIATAKAK